MWIGCQTEVNAIKVLARGPCDDLGGGIGNPGGIGTIEGQGSSVGSGTGTADNEYEDIKDKLIQKLHDTQKELVKEREKLNSCQEEIINIRGCYTASNDISGTQCHAEGSASKGCGKRIKNTTRTLSPVGEIPVGTLPCACCNCGGG